MKRGDVWLARLDPTVGAEIQKTRPVLVVSPDELNDRLHTVIVVPLTSGSRPTRFRVPIRFQQRDGVLVADHVRSVDRRRLVKNLGTVEPDTLAATLKVLANMFAE